MNLYFYLLALSAITLAQSFLGCSCVCACLLFLLLDDGARKRHRSNRNIKDNCMEEAQLTHNECRAHTFLCYPSQKWNALEMHLPGGMQLTHVLKGLGCCIYATKACSPSQGSVVGAQEAHCNVYVLQVSQLLQLCNISSEYSTVTCRFTLPNQTYKPYNILPQRSSAWRRQLETCTLLFSIEES